MNGTFEFSQWATLTPAEGWRFAVGRFTGGDRDDVVGYQPSDGTIWVGSNTGDAFAMSLWATVDPAEGWQLYAGEFTRDRAHGHPRLPSLDRLDGGRPQHRQRVRVRAVGVRRSSGGMVVRGGALPWRADGRRRRLPPATTARSGSARTPARAFTFEQWGTVAPASGWTIAAGDFTGQRASRRHGLPPEQRLDLGGPQPRARIHFNQWATLVAGRRTGASSPGQILDERTIRPRRVPPERRRRVGAGERAATRSRPSSGRTCHRPRAGRSCPGGSPTTP